MIRVTMGHLAACLLVAAPSLGAQGPAPDRSVPPESGPMPAIPQPAWVRGRLPNGIELVISVRRGVPMAAFSLRLRGGATTFDPPGRDGATELLVRAMKDGSRAHPGKAFSDASQQLGVDISWTTDQEVGLLTFQAMNTQLLPAMRLAAEMLLEPLLDSTAFEGIRARTIQEAQGWQTLLNPMATAAAEAALWGGHPFRRHFRPVEPLRRVTMAELRQLHRDWIQPGRAIITVVGDVDPATVRRQVEAAFGNWQGDGGVPAFDYPPPPVPAGLTLHLTDRPGAAQTQFVIMGAIVKPDLRDMVALTVLNQIVGQTVQSRLSRNLRERRGYTYDIWSTFRFSERLGLYTLATPVDKAKTDSALVQILAELRGLSGAMPFTPTEIDDAKRALAMQQVTRFQNLYTTNVALSTLVVIGREPDYYRDYAARIAAVTPEELVRVARTYLDPDRLVIGIAGDRSAIEAPLRRLNLGPMTIHDGEGRPLP